MLTITRKQNLLLHGSGALLGICIAGVAIYMEEHGYWSSPNSLLWFLIAFPSLGIPFSFLWWRRLNFTVRPEEELKILRKWTIRNRVLFAIFALLSLWVSIALLHDEGLDQGFNTFYFGNQQSIPDAENAAIGLAGINAPDGSDFMSFGHAQVEAIQDEVYHNHSTTKNNPVVKGYLEFSGQPDELDCWSLPRDKHIASNCANEECIKILLRDNALLLSRYQKIILLPHFQGWWSNAQLFLNLNKLVAAEILLNIRHENFEVAYQHWRSNYQFLSRMASEENTFVDKAIFMVAHVWSLESIETLIHSDPSIAQKHGDELLTLLKPSGLQRWNLSGMLKREYLMIDSTIDPQVTQFWVHRNFIRNRYYRCAKSYLSAAGSSPTIVEERTTAVSQCNNSKTWSNDYLFDPMNTVFVRAMLGGFSKSGALISQMYQIDGKLIALSLVTMIKMQRIPDGEIEAFLAKAEPDLRNPFTSRPMGWDAKSRVIKFENPAKAFAFDARL